MAAHEKPIVAILDCSGRSMSAGSLHSLISSASPCIVVILNSDADLHRNSTILISEGSIKLASYFGA